MKKFSLNSADWAVLEEIEKILAVCFLYCGGNNSDDSNRSLPLSRMYYQWRKHQSYATQFRHLNVSPENGKHFEMTQIPLPNSTMSFKQVWRS
jgi:hypothetical protein